MTQQETGGLLAIWVDIDDDYLLQFLKWHNCEHIPERLSIPGFRAGRRYRSLDAVSDFLILYETLKADVLTAEPYLRRLNNPTPRTRDALQHFRHPIRTVYSLIAELGPGRPALNPGFMLVHRFDCMPTDEHVLLEWYESEVMAKICAISNVHSGSLYRSRPELSQTKTLELDLHMAGPAAQRFLGLYEISSWEVAETKPWRGAFSGPASETGPHRYMANCVEELYWLDFAMYTKRPHEKEAHS